jgi:rubrerythrin
MTGLTSDRHVPDTGARHAGGMDDRYAHLRANLETHRAATAQRTYVWWCTECGLHQADESGLCPVCRPAPQAVRADEPAA